jgi:hypothetical protein
MSEQVTTILASSAIILLTIAVWGASVAFVTWDTTRRNLSGCQQLLWVSLAIVPLVGFAGYLIARPFVLPESTGSWGAREQPKKRVTFAKPTASGAPKRLPTLPAAEYLQASRPETAGETTANLTTMLTVAEGPHMGEYFVVDELPAYIGRGPGCMIHLDNDRGVSRRHAELYWPAGRLHLRDLDSTHGTNVNGADITDEGLASGDKIRVGYSLLIVNVEPG